MPFTPFHLGPGCAVKAVAGNSFSLTVFAFAQVAMDGQPLIHLLRGEGIVHGISHTYLGATLIALVSLLAGRPLCRYLLAYWTPRPQGHFQTWLRGPADISWLAAGNGAFLGTYSHVFFDSLIHADVEPFAPLVAGNPLAGTIPFGAMHMLCVGIGILGMLGLAMRYLVESDENQPDQYPPSPG